MFRIRVMGAQTYMIVLAGCVVGVISFAARAAARSRTRTSKSSVGHERPEQRLNRDRSSPADRPSVRPVAIATWAFGQIAIGAAKTVLEEGRSALDAVTAGITAVELDTQEQYFVGLGGLPNADGVMEFDAAVMDGDSMSYGAVAGIRDIVTAFKVARLVMERSPHCVLAGEGATKFALANGIEAVETLTEEAQEIYQTWVRIQAAQGNGDLSEQDKGNSHDTIGMICLDKDGKLVAGTSTSGWKFKHPGRVGDSPVVGAGLYCDGRIGAAVATGDGEDILRTCLSFLVVEYMRAGHSPMSACQRGISRLRDIVQRPPLAAGGNDDVARMHNNLTVAVMAMSPCGMIGAASTLGPVTVHRGRPTFPLSMWRRGEEVRVVEESDLPEFGSQKIA